MTVMAQSESLPAPAPPAARPLPMESFLATDDPAWVWDGQGRRILWANAAAAKLWGDSAPERLKRRRQGRATDAPARLTELARSGEALADAPETLAVPAPSGAVKVVCVFQRLQLAGGRPGLVVRVLPERDEPSASSKVALHPSARAAPPGKAGRREPRPAKARERISRSDLGTLKAIARDIGAASGQSAPGNAIKAAPREGVAASSTGEAKTTRSTRKTQPTPSGKSAPTAKHTKTRAPHKKTAAAAAAPEQPSREEMAALLARVSHEIRNPLTIILGFAEILQSDRVERLKPGKAREYASDIYRTAQLALGLADDLLGFAERASGEPPPAHAWIDLNTVIADCLHLLEPVATAQNVTLGRRLKRDSPMLLAHERSIRQILLNLLMNALRHGEGGGAIRVSTRLEKQGGLVLSVKDDGPGMSAEQIAAAKSPDRAGDVKQAGRRGLGLRLVLGFVRDNAGELDIISKPGAGADVRIRFAPDRLSAPKARLASKKPAVKKKLAMANGQATKRKPARRKQTPGKRA